MKRAGYAIEVIGPVVGADQRAAHVAWRCNRCRCEGQQPGIPEAIAVAQDHTRLCGSHQEVAA